MRKRKKFMKHFFRIMTHLAIKLMVNLPLTLVGIPILAIVLLFLDNKAKQLPTFIRWFDNADNDGLYGDIANQQRNIARGINPKGYLAKLIWLGFRNPINYFKYRVLGIKISDINKNPPPLVEECSDVPGQHVSDYAAGGFRYVELELYNQKKYYEYYLIKPYHAFHKPLCFRARIGWKIGHPEEPQKERSHYAWTCAINPCQPFRG